MSLRAQAARGLKWQAVEIGGRQVISLATFTVLARLLDPTAFGLVGIIWVIHAFIAMFIDLGIGMAIIQRKDLKPDHINAAFWSNVVCASVMAGAILLFAGPIAVLLRNARLEPLLRWSSLALLINSAAGVQHALFFRSMDFRRPAIRTLLGNLLGGGVGVIMAVTGWGVWSLVGQQLAAAAAGTVFLWTASTWRPSLSFSYLRLGELMGTGISVFCSSILWFISTQMSPMVIGRFMGAGVLGQFVVADKVTQLAKMAIHGPVNAVSMPAFSQLQHDHPRMCQAIYKGMQLNAVVSFAVFGGLAAVAPTLLPLAFGEQWRPAGPLLRLVALYMLSLGVFVYCMPALLATGGPGRYVFVNVICAIGSAIACVIGIHFGIRTLIVGQAINITAIGLLALFFLRKRIGLSPWLYCRPCFVPALASIAMFLIVGAIRTTFQDTTSPWFNLILQVIAGGSAYVLVISAMSFGSISLLCEISRHALARTREPNRAGGT